jgi:hypothetical protein
MSESGSDGSTKDQEDILTVVNLDKLIYQIGMASSVSEARRFREAGAVWIGDGINMEQVKTLYIRWYNGA